MNKDKEWYMAWSPGSLGYSRDDIIIAVGVKCADSRFRFSEAISWLGRPNLVDGNINAGHAVYYFEENLETVGHFEIINGVISGFGTITRSTDNSIRDNNTGDGEIFFNILDLMEDFDGSEMEKSTQSLL